MGDAGALAQPFTGSGVFKGINNAIDLAKGLKKANNNLDGITEWSKTQALLGKRLYTLGMQMEKAFIWDAPDFAMMDGRSTETWWKNAVSFPDTFTYQDEH